MKNRWIQLLAVALPTWGLGYVSERTGFFWFGPLGVALSAAMAWYAFGGGTVGLHALGFERPRSWAWTIGGALLTAIGVHIAISLAAIVVIPRWGPPNFGAFKNLHGHPLELLKFLVIIWTTAAFGEEIILSRVPDSLAHEQSEYQHPRPGSPGHRRRRHDIRYRTLVSGGVGRNPRRSRRLGVRPVVRARTRESVA